MDKEYIFNKVCECEKVKIERVFPTKQLLVKRIHDSFKNDARVVCMVLFGSSVSIKCNSQSDIDLLVRLSEENINSETKNDISEKIQELSGWNADIIWYDRLKPQDRIYNRILKGVQIV